MGTTQKVSCESMKTDAESIAEALKEIPDIIEQLQVSMKNLAHCWEGAAWAAFQEQVNKDLQNIQETYQNFIKLQENLGKGSETYLKTEYDVYTDIQSIWI